MKRDTALSINPFPCSARKVLLGQTAARRSRPARARNAPPCTGATIWADCKALFQVPEALAVLFMLVGLLYIYATATLAAVLFFLLPSVLPPPLPSLFINDARLKAATLPSPNPTTIRAEITKRRRLTAARLGTRGKVGGCEARTEV